MPQVSVKGRASEVSLLQMSTYSGLCALVRLLVFRNGQRAFPLSFVELLKDPKVLKVGVGCYEDGKRLTRDHGLVLSCTVDLRYLAMRQRCCARLPRFVPGDGAFLTASSCLQENGCGQRPEPEVAGCRSAELLSG